MNEWKERGIISKHDLAWSRQGSEKVYVQHLMEKNGEEIWNWIEGGAFFYVCGDKQYMAKDEHRALIEIAMEHGGMSEADATFFIEKTMMKEQYGIKKLEKEMQIECHQDKHGEQFKQECLMM